MKKITGTKHNPQDSSSPKVGAKMGLAGGKFGTKSGQTKKN